MALHHSLRAATDASDSADDTGLVSLSLSGTGQVAYLSPMAIAIVWGLLFATRLTLFIVPALFAIGDDLVKGRDPRSKKVKSVININ